MTSATFLLIPCSMFSLKRPLMTVLLVTLVCLGFIWEPTITTTSIPPIIKEDKKSVTQHVLFFNRVPKCGSEMFVLLLQWLQGENQFRHIRLRGNDVRQLNFVEQENLVQHIATISKQSDIPVSFDRHVYFTNFTSFGHVSPIFMNLVRDPIDKILSRFYYARVTPNPLNPDIKFATTKKIIEKPFGSFEQCFLSGDPECQFQSGKPYDLTIPYFCGHEQQCMILSDKWALARAKSNIESFYPIVGVLDELNITLQVLEYKVPTFFRGVQNMYFNELLQPHKNANRKKPHDISPKIRKKLQKLLETEYDLYYWLIDRLRRQHRMILNERMTLDRRK